VGLAEGVLVPVAVGETVGLAVGEAVFVAVGEAVPLTVGEAVRVAVGDAVRLAVGEAVRVAVGLAVRVAVFVAVRVAVLVAVRVAVRVKVGVAAERMGGRARPDTRQPRARRRLKNIKSSMRQYQAGHGGIRRQWVSGTSIRFIPKMWRGDRRFHKLPKNLQKKAPPFPEGLLIQAECRLIGTECCRPQSRNCGWRAGPAGKTGRIRRWFC
jgi:hypothetical protein